VMNPVPVIVSTGSTTVFRQAQQPMPERSRRNRLNSLLSAAKNDTSVSMMLQNSGFPL